MFCSLSRRVSLLGAFARKMIVLALLIGLFPEIQASHDMGAYIRLECVNNCTTRVISHDWQDCSAIPGPGASHLDISASGGPGCTNPVLIGGSAVVSTVDLTPLFPQPLWSYCSNTNSPLSFGVVEYQWEQLVDLCATGCDDYRFSWELCCRYVSSSLTQSFAMHFWTDLDASAAVCNSTPIMQELPPVFMGSTDTMLFDLSGFDPDGDSLVYTLFACYSDSGVPVVYNPGFSATSPHGPNWGFSLDAQTGLLRVTPSANPQIVTGPICYMIEEFRNGVKLSETHLDMPAVHFTMIPENTDPLISGPANVSGGLLVGDTLYMAAADTLTFELNVTDPDTGIFQDLFLHINSLGSNLLSQDTSGAAMDTVSAKEPIGRYVVNGPVTVGVYDLQAQARDQLWVSNWISRDTFDFVIKVLDSLPPVWPGDANNDLIANNLDVLALGLAFGSTGPVRPNASISWTGQPALPWSGNIPSGPNLKFADCDGNGTVNNDDTLAVFQNYGLVHNKTGGTEGTMTDPELIVAIPPDSTLINDTIHAPIYLGTQGQPANLVYGVAFSVNYDTALVKSGSMHIDFNSSWMGGTQPLRIGKDLYDNGQFDAAHVRTDQMAVTGNGQIGTLHFIITDNIDGKTASFETLRLFVTNVHLIDANGIDLGVNPIGDSVVVGDVLNGQAPLVEGKVKIWPQPARELLQISAPFGIQKVELLDLQGRNLNIPHAVMADTHQFQTGDLAEGIYFIRLHTKQGILVRRWIKL